MESSVERWRVRVKKRFRGYTGQRLLELSKTNEEGYRWVTLKGEDFSVRTAFLVEDSTRKGRHIFRVVRVDGDYGDETYVMLEELSESKWRELNEGPNK